MSMTDATPEQLAERIATKVAPFRNSAEYRAARDAALAAIIETTERAAKWLNAQTLDDDEYDAKLDRLAAALRNQEHLKND